jgi:hypothetical protein
MFDKEKQMGQIYVINSIATLAFRISEKKSLVTEQQLIPFFISLVEIPVFISLSEIQIFV